MPPLPPPCVRRLPLAAGLELMYRSLGALRSRASTRDSSRARRCTLKSPGPELRDTNRRSRRCSDCPRARGDRANRPAKLRCPHRRLARDAGAPAAIKASTTSRNTANTRLSATPEMACAARAPIGASARRDRCGRNIRIDQRSPKQRLRRGVRRQRLAQSARDCDREPGARPVLSALCASILPNVIRHAIKAPNVAIVQRST